MSSRPDDKINITITVSCSRQNSFRVSDNIQTLISDYIKYNGINDNYLSFKTNVEEAEVMRVDANGSKIYK